MNAGGHVAAGAPREDGTIANSIDQQAAETENQRLIATLEHIVKRDEAAIENEALTQQQTAFDQMIAVRTEQQREYNALRDLMLTQAKQDDEALKKWIALI